MARTRSELEALIKQAEARIKVYTDLPKRSALQTNNLLTNLKSDIAFMKELVSVVDAEPTTAPAVIPSDAPALPPDPGTNVDSSSIYKQWSVNFLLDVFGTTNVIVSQYQSLPANIQAGLAAAGNLGAPHAPSFDGIDWSLFTGVASTDGTAYAYIRGKEVATAPDNGTLDSIKFGRDNGIDYPVQ